MARRSVIPTRIFPCSRAPRRNLRIRRRGEMFELNAVTAVPRTRTGSCLCEAVSYTVAEPEEQVWQGAALRRVEGARRLVLNARPLECDEAA